MKRGKKRLFGRVKNQRKALLRSLATALLTHGKIKTTRARAKVLTTLMDKLITKAKQNSSVAGRVLLEDLGTTATKDLNTRLEGLAGRNSGYTRTTNLPRRHSDGAPIVMIEFVQ